MNVSKVSGETYIGDHIQELRIDTIMIIQNDKKDDKKTKDKNLHQNENGAAYSICASFRYIISSARTLSMGYK